MCENEKGIRFQEPYMTQEFSNCKPLNAAGCPESSCSPKPPLSRQLILNRGDFRVRPDTIRERMMPLTPDQLLSRLDELGYETTTHQHEAVFTVEESAKIKQEIPGGHTKNLFLKDKKGNYFLIVAEGVASIKLNSVHGLIGAKGRVSFGKPEDLMELLGVKPGSVTAFAPVNDKDNRVKVVIDEALLRYELINCHPLTNEMTTTISRENLLDFLEQVGHPPAIIQVSQTEQDA